MLSALPVEVVQKPALFSQAFKRAAGLSRPPASGTKDDGVDQLETEWMSGVLFYLNATSRPSTATSSIRTRRWALTSISQRPVLARRRSPGPPSETGQVQDILSTIISDWNTPGDKMVTTTARASTRAQIFDETWAQLKAHLAQAGTGALRDSDVDRTGSSIRPSSSTPTASSSATTEPLLINTKQSRAHRPVARTNVANFSSPSDYVLTETDLACMEAANEAARDGGQRDPQPASGSSAPPCTDQAARRARLFRHFSRPTSSTSQSIPTQPPILLSARRVAEPSPGLTPSQCRARSSSRS